MCMYTSIITDLHAQALPSTIKPLQQLSPLLCDTTNPANLCFLHPPAPLRGAPLPETWTYVFGFSSAQMLSAFCLSIPPSFLFSCLFLKIKIWWGICCSQQCCSPSDRNVQHETSHSKLSQLLQLWKRNRHQGSDESTYTLFSYNNGFIAEQSVFPSALVMVIALHWLPKLMVEWPLHARHNMLYQRAVSLLTLHICGGRASFVMGQETSQSLQTLSRDSSDRGRLQCSILNKS